MEGIAQQSRRGLPETLNSGISTGQLAARLTCSAQHIRNLERDGVIPPSTRAPNGYRRFGTGHLHAARAYRALSAAVGPVEAKSVLRKVLAEPATTALHMDELHARLHAERTALRRVTTATRAISAETISEQHVDDGMSIGLLAAALGVRTSTLRHWESEGLLVPRRRSRARSYSPADVRDARIVDQLRRAGYRIPDLRPILDDLRRIGMHPGVLKRLAQRGHALDARSQALLAAGAHLLELVTGPGD